MGIFPQMVSETDKKTVLEYYRGEGLSVRDATIERDKKMLNLIL